MNHAGEIAKLIEISKPHIALITNIGEAHIQNFKSKDNIAEAKKELLNNSDQLETAILPRDDDYYQFLAKDKELAQLYPKWNDFKQLRKELDPTNKFLNTYLTVLFNE